MPSVASFEPETIITGDTAAWKKAFADYLAGTWELSYIIANGDNSHALAFGTEVTADGTGFAVNVPAATTAAWATGE